MNINISIKTPDLKQERKNTDTLLQEVLYRSMVKMEEIAKYKAPVDTGNLRARIHLNPAHPGANSYVLSDGVEYGIHVEYGTKPHYFYASFQAWAERVLGKAISIRGTPAQPFFRPSVHEVKYKWLPIIIKQVFGQ